jgi:extracellular elastinolytic metalloproteinase
VNVLSAENSAEGRMKLPKWRSNSSRGRSASAFRRLLHEPLEGRSLLTGTAGIYLPPRFQLDAEYGYLTGPAVGDPLDIALGYLRNRASDVGLTPADLEEPNVTSRYVSEASGITNIYLRQVVEGLEVAYADIGVHLTSLGEIINVNGGFVLGLANLVDFGLLSLTPALTPEEAVQSAALSLGLTAAANIEARQSAGDENVWIVDAPGISLDEISARLHWVPTPEGSAALAWQLIVRTPDNEHWYDLSVHAHSGSMVAQNDWSNAASYNVVPLPLEAPNDGPFQVVVDPHLSATNASPFGWHDTNGVAGHEFTDTRGNNADVHLDRDGNNTADTTSVPNSKARPDGGASLNFSTFTHNPALAPSVAQNQDAAMVNAFYWMNVLHDVHYQYGFTSAAGNFQTNTYGLGGLGSDAVQVDVQDNANGGSTNNANFSTPPDGSPPRTQFRKFTNTSPRRDSALDTTLLIHEYGHGVSNRLTGGPANASALEAIQSTGMGEGWSDWWAIMLTQQTAAETTSGRGVGTYLRGQTPSGSGIRDFRYDFDIGVQTSETFLHFGTGVDQDTEVHDSGTRWAAALWDLNHLLIQKYGFEPNFYNSSSTAGNIRALHLVMNALQLQPANPSFIEGRDAILLADRLLYGGVNQDLIWAAFARRGLGEGAWTPSANSTILVASFEAPGLTATASSPSDGSVVATPPTSFTINFSSPVNPGSLDAADLTVNGIAADSVVLSNLDQTATFTYLSSPVTAVGAQTMSLAANSIERASDADGVEAFSATFQFGAAPLAIESTFPLEGGAFTLPGPFTFDVHFNQPVNPSSVQTGDLSLAGMSGAAVTSAALLEGNTKVRFTIGGISSEGALTATIAAGAITSTFVQPNPAFSAIYHVDIDSDALAPHVAKFPLGSLAFEQSEAGVINFAGDTEVFRFSADSGQSISVIARANSTGLAPTLALRDPLGTLLATATSAGLGRDALLQTFSTTISGIYTVTVGSATGSTGKYAVEVFLNAAIEEADLGIGNNNTRATAQNLDTEFTALFTPQGVAARAAVLGRVGSSAVVPALDSGWWSNAGAHTSTNTNYLAGPSNRNFFVFDLRNVRHPVVAADFQVALPSNNGYNSDDAFETYALFDVSTPIDDLQAGGSTGTSIFADLGTGTSFGQQNFVDADEGQVKVVTLNPSGIGAINAGSKDFFAFGGAPTTTSDGGALFANSGDFALTKQLVLNLDNTQTDFYSFSLAAGQRVTVGLRHLTGSGTTLSIQEASGATVATGVSGGNLHQLVTTFTAPTTGTYYIVVGATNYTTYNVVITRETAFDLEANSTSSTAQALGVAGAVVGAVAQAPVVPSHRALTEGNSSNNFPFNIGGNNPTAPSMRYQQIYARAEFGQAGLITALRFRRDGGALAFSTSGISVQINLGYAATSYASPSTTFANNIGAGTTTVLDTTNLTLSSSSTESPRTFDVVIPLTTPFFYDPAQGDLLLDIFMRNSPTTRSFDTSVQGQQNVTRRITATSVTATTGTIDSSFSGLVTRFDMADEDWYSFSVANTAHRLRVETSTPADGSNEFANTLNPRIELYNPSNVLVASGTAQADGRNEFVQFQPTVTGTYRVRVLGESGTAGEYVLTRDNSSPRVLDTSILPGQVLAPGNLTVQVTFSEPMLASNLNASDYNLRGNSLAIDYNSSSAQFSPDGMRLTFTYENLPDDSYTLTLTAGTNGGANFTNLGGNALDGEFSSIFPSGNGSAGGNFVLNFSLQPPSETLTFVGEAPAGSLIYEATIERAIAPIADVDTYTFAADAGQTIVVEVVPNVASLQPYVTLLDPAGNIVQSDVADGPGQGVLLAAAAPTSGAAGSYQVVVGGASSATGQYKLRVLLNSVVEPSGSGPLGSNKSPATAQNLDPWFTELPSTVTTVGRAAVVGNVGSITLSAIDSGWWDQTGFHGATNKNYVAGQELPTTFRNYFVFDLATVDQPIAAAELRLFTPHNGYAGDATETYTVFDVFTPISTLRASASGQVGIFNDLGSGTIYGSQNFEEVNEGDLKTLPLNSNGVLAVNNAAGGEFAVGGAITSISGSGIQQTFGNSRAAGSLLDTRQLVLTVFADSDYYSLTLEEGQKTSVALRNILGGGVTFEIRDAHGQTLASSTAAGGTNVDEVLADFVAPTDSVYYIVVMTTGAAADYHLVVTRDAAFEVETNSTPAVAQVLGGNAGVLGGMDYRWVVVPSHLAEREANGSNGFPFNLPTNSAASMRYQQIYSHVELAEGGMITALRFRRNGGTEPFTAGGLDLQINLSQAATTVDTISAVFANNIGGGATTVYDSMIDGPLTLTSTYYGEAPYPFDIVIPLTTPFFYDPSQGDLLLDVLMRNAVTTEQFEFASAGTQTTMRRVFATDVNATVGSVDFTTNPTYAGLLTQFDFAPSDDWYSFEVTNTSSRVRLHSSTPLDGPNQPVNVFNPRLALFDPAGTLVAAGVVLPDGRNESIDYQPLVAGTYRVRVVAEGGASGEYFLSKNVSPVISNLAVTAVIDENDSATLTGTIDDPDSWTRHTLQIDWGTGDAIEEIQLAAGQASFSISHVYRDDNPSGTPFDLYGVHVTVIDEAGDSAAASASVIVNNVAPTLVGLAATPIPRNGTTTFTGTIEDTGPLDIFTLTIDWGNGIETLTDIGAGPFSLTRSYPDNGSSVFPIHIAVLDDDEGIGEAATTVVVLNTSPVAHVDSFSVSEDALLTIDPPGILLNDTDAELDSLVAVLIDPPTHGNLTVQSNGSITYAPPPDFFGVVSFTYLASDGLAESEVVTVTIQVTAVNDPPTISGESSSILIDEGSTATNHGVFADIDFGDVPTISASKGTITQTGSANGQWTWSYNGLDDEPSHIVTITANDGQGGFATFTFLLAVQNVAPLASDNDYATAQGTIHSGNVILDNTGAGTDTDAAVDHDPLQVISHTDPLNGSLLLHSDGSFNYTPFSTFSGTDSFTYTISDGDGGLATATVTIDVASAAPGSVQIVPDTSTGGTSLLISGTSAADQVIVSPGPGSTLTVILNAAVVYVPVPSGRIIVLGGSGDDIILIAGAVNRFVWLYGEAGNDTLNAGNGGSVLVGGDGNDILLGGNGRDIMIGGEGADKLIGHSNDDILVAGFTNYDRLDAAGHDTFWRNIVAEWASGNSFAARVQNLHNGTGGNSHNNGSFLLPNVVDDVFADDIDFLNGTSGNDWLIFRSDEDRVAGHSESTN